MKLEKSLLLLIAAAVVVTAPACTKGKDGISKKDKKEQTKTGQYGCPGCGLG